MGGGWKSANHRRLVRSTLPHSAQAEIKPRIQASNEKGLLPGGTLQQGSYEQQPSQEEDAYKSRNWPEFEVDPSTAGSMLCAFGLVI